MKDEEDHEVPIRVDSDHLLQFRKGCPVEGNRVVEAGVKLYAHPQTPAAQSLDMGVSGGGRMDPQFEVWRRSQRRRVLGFGSGSVVPLWAFRRMGELGVHYLPTRWSSIGRTRGTRWIGFGLLVFGEERLRRPRRG